MAVQNKAIDKQSLKGLSPFGKFTPDKIDDIISKSRVENLPAGRVVFRQGDSDSHTIYLLSGQIELTTAGKSRKKTIKGKSVESKFPLADEIPRPATARTKIASSLLYIDSSLLEILLDENPSGEYEVTEIDVSDHATDWMMRFLQSRAFLKLPTENIQKVLMSMEEIHVSKGDTIVSQGEDGDYYYIIKKGQCAVSRRLLEKASEVRLARLAEGDGFGEEALITQSKRNASVKMLEDGVLMRLGKDDFLSLLVTPLIRNIHLNSLKNNLYQNAVILDIRSNTEFKQGSLDKAKHIPLSMIRLRIPTLDHKRQHLIYSGNKDDANAAAFLLAQHGIECSVILGTLQQILPVVGETAKKDNATDRQQAAGHTETPVVSHEAQKPAPSPESITKAAGSARVGDQPVIQADKPVINRKLPPPRPENIKLEEDTETLRMRAKKDADQMLAEAEAIRNSAIQEALRLKNKIEKEEVLKLKTELEDTRSRAEAAIRQSKQLAEQIRQQAEQESSHIRRQALSEAEKLRAELDQLREQEAQMKLQLESELLRLRQEAAEQARLEAEQEAEKARIAAEKAAEQAKAMALREAEETRAAAKQAAEKARIAAIRKAEATLASAEHAAAEARAAADRLTEEAQAIERQAAQARHKAEQEANAIRQAALNEANRIKQSALQESERIKNSGKAEVRPLISHDNVFNLEEELSPTTTPVQPYADEASVALKMAEEIKAKLIEVEEQRIASEHQSHTNPGKQKARLKRLENKVILEGDEDIFIFKEPKKQHQDKTLIEQVVMHPNPGDRMPVTDRTASVNSEPGLPKAEPCPDRENLLDFPVVQPIIDLPEYPKEKKSLFAIAASIFMVISLSLVAYTTKIQINFSEVDALVNQETIESEEKKIKEQARKDFRKKVSSLK